MSEPTNSTATPTVRIKQSHADNIDQLRQTCQLGSREDVLNVALSLLNWAVAQKKMGCDVCSHSPMTDDLEILNIAALNRIAGPDLNQATPAVPDIKLVTSGGENMKITIHADGACSGNPGPGGWGTTVQVQTPESDSTIQLQGGSHMTTNNIMELTAARAGLEYVVETMGAGLKNAQITLRLDSEYVLKGMRDWMPGWKRKDWRGSTGKEVKNKDVWIAIEAAEQRLNSDVKIKYVHVRGHSGDPENERVDAIAVEARDLSRRNKTDWSATPRLVSEPDNDNTPKDPGH